MSSRKVITVFISNTSAELKMIKGIVYSDILVKIVQDHICFLLGKCKKKDCFQGPTLIHIHDYNFFIISERKIIKIDKQMTFILDFIQSNRSFQYVKIFKDVDMFSVIFPIFQRPT